MNTFFRRILLGIGAALLVGGWGVTKFVPVHMEYVSADRSAVEARWHVGVYWKETTPDTDGDGVEEIVNSGYKNAPMKCYYATGIACMALGAALLGFAWLKGPEPAAAA